MTKLKTPLLIKHKSWEDVEKMDKVCSVYQRERSNQYQSLFRPPDMRPEPPPIQSEVDKAITLLSFGKAPDIHNCPADLIKMSGEHGKKASYTYARKFGTRIAGHQSGRNSNLFCSTNPEIRKKAPTTEQL